MAVTASESNQTTIVVHILPSNDSTTLELPIDTETVSLPIDATNLTLPIDATTGTFTLPLNSTILTTHNIEIGPKVERKHATKVVKKGNVAKLVCHICQKEFTRNSNLMRHRRGFHGEEKNLRNRIQPTPYQCTDCGLYYTAKGTLKIHMQTQHGIDVTTLFKGRNSRMGCLHCEMTFKMAKELCKHYEEIHGIMLDVDHLEFNTFDDFMAWKKEIEVETSSSFVRYSGDRRSKNGELVYLMFRCRRSGHHVTRGIGLRRMKRNGSVRINGHCPARIQASRGVDGHVQVTFTKTHLGHNDEPSGLSVEQHRELEEAKSKFIKEITRATIRCESEEELETLKQCFETVGSSLEAIRRKKRRAQLRAQFGSMPRKKKINFNIIQ
ncbi:hypothetical protein CHUAL_014010 [Chamberlinius hualienensis]